MARFSRLLKIDRGKTFFRNKRDDPKGKRKMTNVTFLYALAATSRLTCLVKLECSMLA